MHGASVPAVAAESVHNVTPLLSEGPRPAGRHTAISALLRTHSWHLAYLDRNTLAQDTSYVGRSGSG